MENLGLNKFADGFEFFGAPLIFHGNKRQIRLDRPERDAISKIQRYRFVHRPLSYTVCFLFLTF
jgi:hypothetical protein